MRTTTTKSDAESFRACFQQTLEKVLEQSISDVTDQQMCQTYEALTRNQRYGFFPEVARLMRGKSSLWCAKHYHNSFRRALFCSELTKSERMQVREETVTLSR